MGDTNLKERCAAANEKYQQWESKGRYDGPDTRANWARLRAEQEAARASCPPVVDVTSPISSKGAPQQKAAFVNWKK